MFKTRVRELRKDQDCWIVQYKAHFFTAWKTIYKFYPFVHPHRRNSYPEMFMDFSEAVDFAKSLTRETLAKHKQELDREYYDFINLLKEKEELRIKQQKQAQAQELRCATRRWDSH